MFSIASWNVNGIRAAEKKGLFEWFKSAQPDVLCLQETKAQPEQLSEQCISQDGYKSHWSSAQKKGYAGVAVYTKKDPEEINRFDIQEFDDEGRVLIIEYPELTIVNTYFPNSQRGGARLDYKLAFCEAIFERCSKMTKKKRNFVLCGDFNIAHKPIDLTHPKANEKTAGYLPEERSWMDSFVEAGFIDTFRMFNKEPNNYTWWSQRTNAREKNVGWRLDYHCIPPFFSDKVKKSVILSDAMGSDHCPVWIELKV